MNFNRLAPFYRMMESVCAGEKLQRCRTAWLDKIPAARNILLLGEGPGRGLRACLHRFPQARITCLDGSDVMLAKARWHCRHSNLSSARVRFIHADVESWVPMETGYDLVVTYFFLDCFPCESLARVIQKIAPLTQPATNWLVADFQIAASGWQRLRSRLILWSLYRFFRITTRLPARHLANPDPVLQQAGFRLVQRIETEWRLLRSDWWQRQSIVS